MLFAQVLKSAVSRHSSAILKDPSAEFEGFTPEEEAELPNLDAEIAVGGVYLRLLAANPGWALRKPKETLGELIETFLHEIQRDNVR